MLQLHLQDILISMYPDANINEETNVILTSQDYLSNVSHIISTTDLETRNGYMMWTLVNKYLPYLYSKVSSAWNTFHSNLLGTCNMIFNQNLLEI